MKKKIVLEFESGGVIEFERDPAGERRIWVNNECVIINTDDEIREVMQELEFLQ